jgi:hypothetical protein
MMFPSTTECRCMCEEEGGVSLNHLFLLMGAIQLLASLLYSTLALLLDCICRRTRPVRRRGKKRKPHLDEYSNQEDPGSIHQNIN